MKVFHCLSKVLEDVICCTVANKQRLEPETGHSRWSPSDHMVEKHIPNAVCASQILTQHEKGSSRTSRSSTNHVDVLHGKWLEKANQGKKPEHNNKDLSVQE
ncbi:uncharacterized protein [Acropora muricata]|uniref:uncharacterized protein LOC122962424 n=1 Tax=Acropora millepora TaxID=45264 RepID=UPI001CF5B428|nr:uncharacterized protein LOC122962424 [Acropora millepora]